jgi:hypothetical protein
MARKEYRHKYMVLNPACVVGFGFKISITLHPHFLGSKKKFSSLFFVPIEKIARVACTSSIC